MLTVREADEYGFFSLVVKSKNRGKISKIKCFPQEERKCSFVLYNAGLKKSFPKI